MEKDLDQKSLPYLQRVLDKIIPDGIWLNYETETLALGITSSPSQILLDKISVLKVILQDKEMFFSNILFFLHATEVINNIEANFDFLPTPTSLEMAYSIVVLAQLLKVKLHELPHFSPEVAAGITELLINEGYSTVVPPFDVVGITKLTPGQTEEDTNNKIKAIEQYVTAMSN